MQRLVHRLHLVPPVVTRGIEHVQQEVGLLHLFERRLERGHQVGGQFLNETNGVGEEHLAPVGQPHQAGRRIEGDEQRVLDLHLRVGQGMEQGRFAAVRIADDGDHRVGDALASLATQGSLLADLLDLLVQLADPVANAPAVTLEFLLAGASGADTGAQAGEVATSLEAR